MIHNTLYKIQLPGLFNIENALAGTCVGLAYGIDLEIIKKALEKIKGVPGRMERVPNDKRLNIVVDYAVTPDSLEKLYEFILQTEEVEPPIGGSTSKIIAIFGACGERDRGKRPIMGEIVAKYADYIIVTNEDPYGEDPMQIMNEVATGVIRTGSFANAQDDILHKTENINFWKIMDRREAIKKALQIAKPGDFIIVTGKGAEETMAVGKKRIPWNDKKVIQEVLQEL